MITTTEIAGTLLDDCSAGPLHVVDSAYDPGYSSSFGDRLTNCPSRLSTRPRALEPGAWCRRRGFRSRGGAQCERGAAPVRARHRPLASYARAQGLGIPEWQLAHTGFLRCCSSRSRTEVGALPSWRASGRLGTFGGGGEGGVPRTFSSSHFPRTTGDVRVAYDVTVRMLA